MANALPNSSWKHMAGTGAGQFGVADISGAATLDGTLSISLIGGFIPSLGDSFEVMTFSSRAGEFSKIEGQGVGGGTGLRFIPNYSTDCLVLEVVATVPPDFDEDGNVDDVDFAHFEACFSGPTVAYTGDCSNADFDTDNDVDQTDFGVFQRCYSGENNPADPDCAN